MAVYVDDMYRSPAGQYGRMKMSHMLADTDAELHAMADKIGVARRWWQSPERTSGSHYDISMSKRVLAIQHGAIEITWRQMGAMNARRRATGELGQPGDAEDWLRARSEQRNAERAAAINGYEGGARCACLATGCQAGPGCPHFSTHCRQHIAHVTAQMRGDANAQ